MIIITLLLPKCLGHCFTAPKTNQFCFVSRIVFLGVLFPSKMTQHCVHSRPGLSSYCFLSLPHWGQRSPIMLCMTPAQVPFLCSGNLKVTVRVSIICQNCRDPSVNCGGTASKEVCHGPEANDLESVGSLFIQTSLTFSKV
jgi:hypothetical protein